MFNMIKKRMIAGASAVVFALSGGGAAFSGDSAVLGLDIAASASYIVYSGACGQEQTWFLDSEGTLTISGTGRMTNFSDSGPWGQDYKIRNAIKKVIVCEGVTSIGEHAFVLCQNVSEVILPEGIVSIGEYAFSSCKSITRIKLPDSLTVIDFGAFHNCVNLSEITIPDSVRTIGAYAFDSCTNLEKATVPGSVTSIKDTAFYNCYSLTIYCTEGSEALRVAKANGIRYVCHYHDYTGKVTKEATCTERGEKTYTCSCGKSYKEYIPAKGHNYKQTGYEEPTCTRDGEKVSICTVCGNVKTETIKTKGHQFKTEVKEATCTEDGYSVSVCSVCGARTGYTKLPSIGAHDFEITYKTEPTCTSDGYISKKCRRCGYTTSERPPAKGHSLELADIIKYATCETEGSALYRCKSCHYSERKSIPAKGHTYKDEEVVNPDYEAKGYTLRKCTVCGYTYTGNFTPALDPLEFAENGDGTYCLKKYHINKKATNGINITVPSEYKGKPVTVIDPDAFSECVNTKSITLPETVVSISAGTFANCAKLERISVDINNENYVTVGGILYNKNRTKLICCPAKKNSADISVTVTEIEDRAFYNCCNLEEITIPGAVARIGEYAFCNCSKLKKVTIPDKVTIIKKYVFAHCKSLESAELPNTLTNIYEYAFYDCPKLLVFFAPKSLTSIGQKALGYLDDESINSSLIIVCDDKSAAYYYASKNGLTCYNNRYGTLENGISWRFDSYKEELRISGNGDILSRYGYPWLDSSIIYNIKSVIINDGITSIGKNAFEECIYLTDLYLPDSVTRIEDEAFLNCFDLSNLNMPSNLEYIGTRAFGHCVSISDITLPDTLKSVDNEAFFDCHELKNINIPLMVAYIGEHVFGYDQSGKKKEFQISCYKNTAGESYAIANNIPYSALAWKGVIEGGYCGNNTKWTYDNEGTIRIYGKGRMKDYDSDNMPWICLQKCIKKAEIEETVYCVGNNAFFGCTSLTEVVINNNDSLNSYKSIGKSAFENCTDLTSINIPGNVYIIDERAFYGCTSLKNVTVSEGLERIEKYAFYGCKDLTNINFPESLFFIYDYAFSGCKALTDIKLPGKLSSIKDYAFYGCKAVTDINLPESLTEVGECAFVNCGLKSVYIPYNVYGIGKYSFGYNCNSTGSEPVYTKVSAFKIGCNNNSFALGYAISNGFDHSVKNIAAYVIKGNCKERLEWSYYGDGTLVISGPDLGVLNNFMESYTESSRNAAPWNDIKRFIRKVVILNGVGSVGSYAFSNCPELSEVHILGNKVKYISDRAFNNCPSLKSVIIPDSVTSIGEKALGFSGTAKNSDFTLYVNKDTAGEKYAVDNALDYSCYPHDDDIDDIEVTETDNVKCYYNKETLNIYSNGGDGTKNYSESEETPWCRLAGEDFTPANAPIYSVILYEGANNIGDRCFYGYKNLQSVTFPSWLKTIGDYAFYDTSLSTVNIGLDVSEIGDHAFANCEYLTEVNFNSYYETETEIGAYAFANCKNLSEITIPKSVKTIGEYAFGFSHDEKTGCTKIPGFTISCYKDSAAEEYAIKYGFKYSLLGGKYYQAKDPTCENDGNIAYWTYNSNYYTDEMGNNKITEEDTIIKATGHSWINTSFTWSEDNQTCTLTCVCENDSSHKLCETVTATHSAVMPTCTESGEDVYTAVFPGIRIKDRENEDASDIKRIPLEASGHSWRILSYTWSEDNKTCTLKCVCGNDPSHILSETVTATHSKTEPTCTEDGEDIYTAAFPGIVIQGHEDEEISEVKKIPVKAAGHVWINTSFDWSDDNKTCTINGVCENDPSHILCETVTATQTGTAPTCTESGEYTYTATFPGIHIKGHETEELTGVKKVTVEAAGHNWGETKYIWSLEETCCAERVCLNDISHRESEEVAVKYTVTEEPTCSKEGVMLLTADFTNKAFASQSKTESIPMIKTYITVIPNFASGETEKYSDIKLTANGETFVSEDDGKIPVTGLDDGTYDVTVSKPGYAPRTLKIDINNGHPFVYKAEPHGDEIKAFSLSKYGDLDGNGEININDLILMQKKTAGWNVDLVYDETANVDGKEDITIDDLILMQKYVAGWKVSLGNQ